MKLTTKHWIGIVVGVTAVGVGGYFLYQHLNKDKSDTKTDPLKDTKMVEGDSINTSVTPVTTTIARPVIQTIDNAPSVIPIGVAASRSSFDGYTNEFEVEDGLTDLG